MATMQLDAVMSGAWDFAPDPVVSAPADSEDEEDDEPPPPCRRPVVGPWWSASMMGGQQRWLVVVIAMVFLFWIWTTDRNSRKSDAPAV